MPRLRNILAEGAFYKNNPHLVAERGGWYPTLIKGYEGTKRYAWHMYRVENPINRFLGRIRDSKQYSNYHGRPIINFSFEILQGGQWIQVKASVRDYGIKYVIWEPFQMVQSAPRSERQIRNLKIEQPEELS